MRGRGGSGGARVRRGGGTHEWHVIRWIYVGCDRWRSRVDKGRRWGGGRKGLGWSVAGLDGGGLSCGDERWEAGKGVVFWAKHVSRATSRRWEMYECLEERAIMVA